MQAPPTHCIVCGDELPEGRRLVGYHINCKNRAPKKRYVVAGFGSKGNGAHVTPFTHGKR